MDIVLKTFFDQHFIFTGALCMRLCASTNRGELEVRLRLCAPVLSALRALCASTFREELEVLLRKCVGLDVRLR